jgi:hypothetical protein
MVGGVRPRGDRLLTALMVASISWPMPPLALTWKSRPPVGKLTMRANVCGANEGANVRGSEAFSSASTPLSMKMTGSLVLGTCVT